MAILVCLDVLSGKLVQERSIGVNGLGNALGKPQVFQELLMAFNLGSIFTDCDDLIRGSTERIFAFVLLTKQL
jgi:hypothetical protein